MRFGPWLERLVIGVFAALACYGAIAHVLLLAAQPVGEWVVGIAAIAGVAGGALCRPADRTQQTVPPALALGAGLVVAAVTTALVIGALSTPARHWDGAVAWEMKAFWLTLDPTLEQPYFRDPGVFCHSRDYPLLQPLLVAAGNRLLGQGMGRMLFPALYLVLLATVATGLRAAGRQGDGKPALLAALALGLTPMLINPTSGGADSGYADLFLLTCVTAVASALLLRHRLLLWLAVFVTVLVKPEGLVYAAIPVAVALCLDRRRLLWPALAGWLLGAALWLPLEHDLQTLGRSSVLAAQWGALAGVALLVVGGDALLRRLRIGVRGRLWIAALALPAMLLCLPLLISLTAGPGSTMGIYLGSGARILERLPDLGVVPTGFLRYGFLHMGFGLTFWLLALVGLVRLRRCGAAVDPMLAATLVVGLLTVLAPFLLSPESDISHHVRSSMSRLQLHWAGATWLLIGKWLARGGGG